MVVPAPGLDGRQVNYSPFLRGPSHRRRSARQVHENARSGTVDDLNARSVAAISSTKKKGAMNSSNQSSAGVRSQPGRRICIVAVVTVCVIVLLSVIPGNMQIRTGAPKTVEHLVAYILSGVVLAQAYGGYRRAPTLIAFLIILAGSLEIFQHWVPGRTPDIRDWGASSLGSLVGVVLALCIASKAHPKSSASPQNAADSRDARAQSPPSVVELTVRNSSGDPSTKSRNLNQV